MTGPGDGGYTLRNLQDMLGLSRNDVLGFIEDGFVAPTRGPRNAYRFAFQDVVLLRTAQKLRSADISTAKIRRSLRRLRAQLPEEMPITGLRISAVGDAVAVREHGLPIAAESGQLLFDFEVALAPGAVLSFAAAGERPQGGGIEAVGGDGEQQETEPSDAPPHAVSDYLERGARAVDTGDPALALALYDEGVAAHPTDASLRFNRAVVLEDLGRIDEAVAAYQRCLEQDAGFADAHWNLARLYERRGVQTLALRHFSAYRRLSR